MIEPREDREGLSRRDFLREAVRLGLAGLVAFRLPGVASALANNSESDSEKSLRERVEARWGCKGKFNDDGEISEEGQRYLELARQIGERALKPIILNGWELSYIYPYEISIRREDLGERTLRVFQNRRKLEEKCRSYESIEYEFPDKKGEEPLRVRICLRHPWKVAEILPQVSPEERQDVISNYDSYSKIALEILLKQSLFGFTALEAAYLGFDAFSDDFIPNSLKMGFVDGEGNEIKPEERESGKGLIYRVAEIVPKCHFGYLRGNLEIIRKA